MPIFSSFTGFVYYRYSFFIPWQGHLPLFKSSDLCILLTLSRFGSYAKGALGAQFRMKQMLSFARPLALRLQQEPIRCWHLGPKRWMRVWMWMC